MKNFEQYKTAKERFEAHQAWCNAKKSCVNDRCNCVICAFEWLDLEAKKEKPMDCPYCGRPILGTRGTATTVRFVCDCGYSSRECHTIEEAIAAHNRVCRAVKAANKESEVK